MFTNLLSTIRSWFDPGTEISYSRITAYKTCPCKYKLIYLEGRHLPPNPFISLGLSIHRTLEDFHSRKGNSFDALIESYDKSWVNEGFLSPQQTQDFFEKGQRMLENYWESNRDSRSEILYIEKEFSCRLTRNRLRGIIDRVDRTVDGIYEVIDYKTHAELWNQSKVDSDLQLSLYAIACKKVFGFTPGKLSYYFLAHNKKVSTTRSKEQLDNAAKTAEEVALNIQNKNFTPNLNHCPKCDFRRICTYSPRSPKKSLQS